MSAPEMNWAAGMLLPRSTSVLLEASPSSPRVLNEYSLNPIQAKIAQDRNPPCFPKRGAATPNKAGTPRVPSAVAARGVRPLLFHTGNRVTGILDLQVTATGVSPRTCRPSETRRLQQYVFDLGEKIEIGFYKRTS